MWFLAERQTFITSLIGTVEGGRQDARKTAVTDSGGWGSGAVARPSEEAVRVKTPDQAERGTHEEPGRELCGRRNSSRHLKEVRYTHGSLEPYRLLGISSSLQD